MKEFSLIIFLIVMVFIGIAQTHMDVKADTIKVVNGELVIENATKNTQGYLYNLGNGVTQFRSFNINDTGYFKRGIFPIMPTTSKNYLFPKNLFDTVVFCGGNGVMYAGFNVYSTSNFYNPISIGGLSPRSNYAISTSSTSSRGGITVSGIIGAGSPNFNSFNTGWYLNFNDSLGGNYVDYQSNLYQSDGGYFYGNSAIGYNSILTWGGLNGGGGYLRSAIGFNAGISTSNNGNVKKYMAFHSSGNNSYAQRYANNYYAAFEADSVISTTAVYGVNQHGSNAINNFEGSKFLLPKIPQLASNAYKLSWNPADGSVFVSPDTGNAGSVSFSGNGNIATFTVPHNLGRVPLQVIFQPSSLDAAEIFYVANKTASAFDIVYKTAPATGTNNVRGDYILR